MHLVVERLDSRSVDVGLTQAAIRASMESRLRAARLFDERQDASLFVNTALIRGVFSTGLEYQ